MCVCMCVSVTEYGENVVYTLTNMSIKITFSALHSNKLCTWRFVNSVIYTHACMCVCVLSVPSVYCSLNLPVRVVYKIRPEFDDVANALI